MPRHTQRRRQHHAAAVAAAAFLALLGFCAAAVEVELAPASKWTQCIDDGRLNIRLAVHGSGKLHAGLQLPEHAESCKPSKPTSCKWLAACDARTGCRTFFPGELSGRRKCAVVINASASESRHASIQLDLETAGNWGAIIFGVVLTTVALLAVVAAGCYIDLKRLVASGGKHKQRRRTTTTKSGGGAGGH